MSMTTTRCPYCAEEFQSEAIKCKHCGSWLSGPPEGPAPGSATPPPAFEAQGPRRLLRSSHDRMVFGVCGGLARYLGIDTTLLRVAVAVATVFTGFVPGLVLYAILALVVPVDDAAAY